MARFLYILMLLPLFRTCDDEQFTSSVSQKVERVYITSIKTEMIGFDVVRHNAESERRYIFGPVSLIGYCDGKKMPTTDYMLTLYRGEYFDESIEVKPSSRLFLETFFDVHDLDSAIIEIEYSSMLQTASDYQSADGFVRLRYYPGKGIAHENLSGLPLHVDHDSQNRIVYIEMDSLLGD